MPANLENSAVATGLERVSFHSNSIQWQCQKMFKLPHNFTNLTHLEKQCSKFSKPGFNSTWAINLQMFKLDLEREKEPEIKFPMSIGSLKEQESSRKTSISVLLTMPESAALNMPANLENSAAATGLEKVSFHSNPKERQCQRMLSYTITLPHNYTHLTH